MNILLRKDYTKFVNYWLISLLFMIGLIIIVGGLTRLTDSGLSITTWDVVKGIFPPLNADQWNEAVSLYKQIPQYYLLNLGRHTRLLGRWIKLYNVNNNPIYLQFLDVTQKRISATLNHIQSQKIKEFYKKYISNNV